MATLEDWTDVMYINMYGCNRYGYFGMRLLIDCTTIHSLHTLYRYGYFGTYPSLENCTKPSPEPVFAAMFFIAFTVSGLQVQ
jgi:voltage-gated sodium channel